MTEAQLVQLYVKNKSKYIIEFCYLGEVADVVIKEAGKYHFVEAKLAINEKVFQQLKSKVLVADYCWILVANKKELDRKWVEKARESGYGIVHFINGEFKTVIEAEDISKCNWLPQKRLTIERFNERLNTEVV